MKEDVPGKGKVRTVKVQEKTSRQVWKLKNSSAWMERGLCLEC